MLPCLLHRCKGNGIEVEAGAMLFPLQVGKNELVVSFHGFYANECTYGSTDNNKQSPSRSCCHVESP